MLSSLAVTSALLALVQGRPLLSKRALGDCLSAAGLNFADPSSSNYVSASMPFNLQSDLRFKPAAIVFATSANDLSAAIKCGAQNNLSIAPRGGGHSYIAGGIGGKDGSLVLDTSGINDIEVDDSTGIAKIGAGQHLGPIYLALNDHGRAIAAGTCPNVGIGGHATCGGMGYSGRAHGLAIDQLTAVDFVFANGTIATVTPSANPDEWFAVNGAGTSFGSVAHYYFQTWPAPAQSTGYYISWVTDPSTAAQALLAVQDWIQTSDSKDFGLNFEVWSYSSSPGSIGFNINGALHEQRGSSNFDARLGSLLSKLPSPQHSTYSSDVSWLDILEQQSGGLSLNLTGPHVQNSATFFAKSLALDFTPDAANAMMQYIASNINNRGSGNDFFLQMHALSGYSSAISSVSSSVSSFARRSDLWNGQVYVCWPTHADRAPLIQAQIYSNSEADVPQSGIDFATGIHDAAVNNLGGADYGAYLCYADSAVDNVGLRYYGDSYSRLQALKRQLDPTDLFSYPLGVSAF